MNRRHIILLVLSLSTTLACEELIDVGKPETELSSAVVFEDDLTAVAAISGLYYQLTGNAVLDYTIPASLSADELVVEDGKELSQFCENKLLSINSRVENTWRNSYTGIYNANAIIEALVKSEKISPSLKEQLTGEAKFFRAFYHFYLVNFFGDVPYITKTDYRANGLITRMPVNDAYNNIVQDLTDARTLLAEDYSYSKGERVRVNRWAATALLARVYLYTGDYIRAEEQAGRVIERTAQYDLEPNPNNVFVENNKEAILQLMTYYPQLYTMEAAYLNNPSFNLQYPRIPQSLYDSFEPNDKRKANWIAAKNDGTHTWYYPVKYKETYFDTLGPNEYTVVLRVAEQFLIRAEARAMQDKILGANSAESDLNRIRNRAGLLPTTATTQEEMLLAIHEEMRKEFFTEWGLRWLDLKRTDRANTILSPIKPGWDDNDVLYPIPLSELDLNPNLKPQNDGY